jgi:hypothetical protein
MTAKRELMERWFQKVWIEQDLDAIDDFFVEETQANGIVPDMRLSPQEYRDFVTMVVALVEDIHITTEVVTETGEWFQALFKVTARSVVDSAPVMVLGQVCVRFSGDKFVEAYNSFDFMGFFEQLGQLPEQSIALCLTGQSLS